MVKGKMINENIVIGDEWARRVLGCLWLDKQEISLNACFHSVLAKRLVWSYSCIWSGHRRKHPGTEQVTRDYLAKLGALKFELDGIHWSILGSWLKQSQKH